MGTLNFPQAVSIPRQSVVSKVFFLEVFFLHLPTNSILEFVLVLRETVLALETPRARARARKKTRLKKIDKKMCGKKISNAGGVSGCSILQLSRVCHGYGHDVVEGGLQF